MVAPCDPTHTGGQSVGKPAAGRHRASSILRKPVAVRALIQACQVATGKRSCPRRMPAHMPDNRLENRASRERVGTAYDPARGRQQGEPDARGTTLEKGGYRVIIASNGVEAVRLTQEENPLWF